MAQPLRRPLCQCIGLSSSSIIPRRQFSQISPRWAGPKMPQPMRPSQKAEKSIKVLQKEQMAKGMTGSDMGLLDQTFVTPIVKLSTMFRDPRRYLKFLYTKARSKLSDRASLLMVKFNSPKSGKRWWNRSYIISRRSIRPTATALHTEMYTAFAAGDIHTLRAKCADGIFESFKARIGGRRKGEVWKWELLKYIGSPKVVADRAALMPNMEGMAIRQAVLRIRSLQRLTRMVGEKVVEGTGETKEVLEYLVVQQQVLRWQAEGWKVWGTTKETTLEDVEAWKRRTLGK